jgi:1-phosphofructokinase family hexose kinase
MTARGLATAACRSIVFKLRQWTPKMILAAGLTPAWQQIYVFDRFVPGEVNRAVEVASCASGKVLNVGVALRLLGSESRVLSVMGGEPDQAIANDVAAMGISCRWIATNAPTRTCTTILDRHTGTTTELVENAGAISTEELNRFRDAFREEASAADFVILTGSLSAGAPTNFYRALLDDARCPMLLDIRGPELLLALERHPTVVKPNREELSATVGRPLPRDEDLHRAMAELNDRGAQWVVVSAGKEAVWLRGDGRLFRIKPPKLTRIANPIGCGDVLAAGVAAALVSGLDPPEAVRRGIAVAAESALELLPARLTASRIPAQLANVKVTAIQ